MRKVIRCAIREYKMAVKTKGFIIGLILAPIMMGGGFIAFVLLEDNVDTTDKRVAVIDHSGLLAPAILEAAEFYNANEIHDKDSGEKIKPAYLFETHTPERDSREQLLALSEKVQSGDLHAFIEIGPQVVHPGENAADHRIAYHAKNAALDDVRSWVAWPINNHLRKLRLSDAGIEESEVKDLFFWVNVDGLGLYSVDEASGDFQEAEKASPIEALAVPIALMMLLFLMIMMSVPAMLHSVMEEKTQRIAEVLLSSVSPFEFMMAKLVGGIAVSLTSSIVYLVGGVIAVKYMGLEGYFPMHILPWFFVFMLLAIIMFGAMSAALGATCSEPKDAQSLTFPSILPALVPMFIYFPVVREPLNDFSTWISLIPLFSPMLMVLRMATPETIPAWQPYVSLIGVFVFTIFMVWVGGRIFRVAILLQGTPPSLANIVRWAIRG